MPPTCGRRVDDGEGAGEALGHGGDVATDAVRLDLLPPEVHRVVLVVKPRLKVAAAHCLHNHLLSLHRDDGGVGVWVCVCGWGG